MTSTSINEIQDTFQRIKIFRYIAQFSFLVLIISYFIYLNFQIYSIIIIIIFGLIFLILLALFPVLSNYELARYHLEELIKSLENKNLKKSKYHLDNLALNISKFDENLEDIFILRPAKLTSNKFWTLLKYQIYPRIIANDFNSYIDSLKDLNFAMSNEDSKSFNTTLGTILKDKAEKDETIKLPYEEPFILNQILGKLRNDFSIKIHDNIYLRFLLIAIILLCIGYYGSIKMSSVSFDTTLIGALLIVSIGLATKN